MENELGLQGLYKALVLLLQKTRALPNDLEDLTLVGR